ncbi:hypothetical protein NDU88_003062 [Pleurodeles waltl]|uniref:Uncharacterized protein n=1 Tax=Pleurodeles waltl TaxID=8319 RepID=A0AAV7KTT9_PLEWA|nr:hypothetical protein NDU88_003062 [Pleurodeles waltl]
MRPVGASRRDIGWRKRSEGSGQRGCVVSNGPGTTSVDRWRVSAHTRNGGNPKKEGYLKDLFAKTPVKKALPGEPPVMEGGDAVDQGVRGDGEAPLTRSFMEQLFGALRGDFATLKQEIAAEVKELKREVVELGQRVDTPEQEKTYALEGMPPRLGDTVLSPKDREQRPRTDGAARRPRPDEPNSINPQRKRAKKRGRHCLDVYAARTVSQMWTLTNEAGGPHTLPHADGELQPDGQLKQQNTGWRR